MAGRAGVSLHNIAGAMGHSDAKTTQRYAHHVPDSLREAPQRVAELLTRATLLGKRGGPEGSKGRKD